jgi:urea carboxylase
MEGSGGYQLFGRTCQMWNNYRATDAFEEHEPWLLRFFDRIEFYSVSDDELLDFRDGFLEGARPIDIVRGRFRLKDYLAFLDDNTESIAAFKTKQQTAFEEERARWREATRVTIEIIEETIPEFEADGALPFGATAVESPVPGSIWKILVEPGCEVAEGETLIIVESMKMEIAVCAPASGLVQEVRCAEGRSVQLGQALVILGGAAA